MKYILRDYLTKLDEYCEGKASFHDVKRAGSSYRTALKEERKEVEQSVKRCIADTRKFFTVRAISNTQ